ncbi:MAG: glycosyltransferase family 2 protein [Candidatus Omnitrophica bacterium]|nr:glycosyltransferase family 2 protein [Candidatus Omnitrophota bacterium]
MSVPRVSVIVAVHNGQRHLEASLACVLRQTFSDFELMVVDDGSTDRTPEILSRLSDEDSRLRVIQQEHRGQTASLIRAMRVAQGAYLARQDADDLSHPERFERQLRYFDAHPSVGALGCATEIIDEEGRVLGVMPMRHGIARVRRGLMTLKATMVHSSIMMRRQTYEAVGRYREVFCVSQDTDLWLRMVQRYDVDNLPERLVQWRVSRDGVYTSQREKQLKYGGVALAFAHERARFGEDSYDLLARVGGDLEASRTGPRLCAAQDSLLLRMEPDGTRVAGRCAVFRASRAGTDLTRCDAVCSTSSVAPCATASSDSRCSSKPLRSKKAG